MDATTAMTELANFGAAGLMGAMWLLERKLSRTREQQIAESHQRILRDEQRLAQLGEVVQRNTDAVARFHETQREMSELIKHMLEELHHVQNR